MAAKTKKPASEADRILRDALKLPANDRAEIASCLYGSLKGDDELMLGPTWEKEIRRRLREIGEGKAKLVPRKEAEKWIFGNA